MGAEGAEGAVDSITRLVRPAPAPRLGVKPREFQPASVLAKRRLRVRSRECLHEEKLQEVLDAHFRFVRQTVVLGGVGRRFGGGDGVHGVDDVLGVLGRDPHALRGVGDGDDELGRIVSRGVRALEEPALDGHEGGDGLGAREEERRGEDAKVERLAAERDHRPWEVDGRRSGRARRRRRAGRGEVINGLKLFGVPRRGARSGARERRAPAPLTAMTPR